MKFNSIYKTFLWIAVAIPFFTSCGSDGNDGGGGASADSIVLTASDNTVFEGESVSFTIKDNLDNNVTGQTTLSINGNQITNPYLFNTVGTFTVDASYNSLTDSQTIVVEEAPQPTAITLSSNVEMLDLCETITFTVMDDLGNNVTSISQITVNGVAIDANPYTFSNGGNFTAEATFQSLTSNQLSLDVVGPSNYSDSESFMGSGAPASFTKKVLLEDFTGTWCPNCPPAAAAVADAINSDPSRTFGVGYHYGDPMQIPETSFWTNHYNVTGFPTVYVNGPDTRWNFPNMAQVNNELAETAEVGLAVSAALVGCKLDLEVKVGFASAIGEEIKLMIYLVEDDVTSSSAQAGSSQGTNYVHNDVLREVYTDQLGDVITTANIGVGGVYTRTITGLDLPNTIDNQDNLKVVAYVRNTYTKTFTDYFGDVHVNSPHYDIYNVQEVHVGETKDFD